jgi:hypothetical protein
LQKMLGAAASWRLGKVWCKIYAIQVLQAIIKQNLMFS